jgi:aryl-alcohol dehydrogenase-like predicted oxidoreductase
MEYRDFGGSGFKVSVIGFGGGHIGGEQLHDQDTERLLSGALDLGINLIDTARGYGRSEERIGRFLGSRRSRVILSTKIGYGIEGFQDWTAPIVHAGISAALEKLKTDYLDIVHFHSCPLDVLKNTDLLQAFEKEVKDGRVRVAAYSGENEALQYAIQSGVFKSIQCSLNIADQRAIDAALPQAAEMKLGVIAKRPVANIAWRFPQRPSGNYAEVYWERMQEMDIKPGTLEWLELALRFTLTIPGVHSCIIGTGKLDHMKRNIELASRGKLPDEEYREIRQAFLAHDRNWVGQV